MASFHRFVSNQLRYLFANLEHLLLRKKGGRKTGKDIFKKGEIKENELFDGQEKNGRIGKEVVLIGMTAHHCVKSRVWHSTGSSTRSDMHKFTKEDT